MIVSHGQLFLEMRKIFNSLRCKVRVPVARIWTEQNYVDSEFPTGVVLCQMSSLSSNVSNGGYIHYIQLVRDVLVKSSS